MGIIDYLRQFTFDKLLESEVKLLKNKFTKGGVEPTILKANEYKSRFVESMKQNFMEIPFD